MDTQLVPPVVRSTLKEPKPYAIVTRKQKVKGREVTERGIELRFHAGQASAYQSTARIVAIIAGTQGGKTAFGPWWLYREIALCGPGDYLAVTATYDLFKLKMLPSIREVFEHVLGIARYWAGDSILELCEHAYHAPSQTWVPKPGVFMARQSTDPMWARIILRSAEAAGGLESSTARAAWLDEAGLPNFGLGAWEAILRRLAMNRGRILITTTPYTYSGWLKREVFDRSRSKEAQIDLINFPSTTNPAFPKEEFEERQRTMVDYKFNMFYRGLFERPAGLVFPAYRDDDVALGGHVCQPFAVPPGWRRMLGVDPGPVYYTLLFVAVEPVTDTLIVYRERQHSYQSTGEIVSEVLSGLYWDNEQAFYAYYVGGKSDVQARLDWTNAGAHPVYEPPFGDVESGIDRVTALLRKKRLLVFSSCMNTRDQFNAYHRKLDDQGLPTETIENAKEFHYLDALRYIAAGFTNIRTAIMGQAPAALQNFRGDVT